MLPCPLHDPSYTSDFIPCPVPFPKFCLFYWYFTFYVRFKLFLNNSQVNLACMRNYCNGVMIHALADISLLRQRCENRLFTLPWQFHLLPYFIMQDDDSLKDFFFDGF